MAKGKRTASPKELLRLTPGQFSAAVAGVVLVAAISLAVGYYMGLKSSLRKGMEGTEITESGKAPLIDTGKGPTDIPAKESTAPSITFYSALTKAEPPSRTRPAIRDSGPKSDIKEKKNPAPGILTGGGKGVVIQVASYRKREKAQELLKTLGDSGYTGTVFQADLGPRGVWHRVRIGPFRTLADAKKALAALRDEKNLKGFIVR